MLEGSRKKSDRTNSVARRKLPSLALIELCLKQCEGTMGHAPRNNGVCGTATIVEVNFVPHGIEHDLSISSILLGCQGSRRFQEARIACRRPSPGPFGVACS